MQGDTLYMSVSVKLGPQFKKTWIAIYKTSINNNFNIVEGRIFTHASLGSGRNQGLEFRADPDDTFANDPLAGETTLQLSEINSLEILPWKENGSLWIYGCNTGVERDGWSPAQAFSSMQKILTYGTMGYAYFSEKYDSFDRHDSFGDDPLYLRAYKRGKNIGSGEGSTGMPIPEKRFSP